LVSAAMLDRERERDGVLKEKRNMYFEIETLPSSSQSLNLMIK